MCTLTWFERGAESYELFFNRDERHTRKPAEPVGERQRSGSGPFLAPLDGDFGGTWLAVNERGLALALLNGWEAPEGPAPLGVPAIPCRPRSRGLLIPELIGCPDPAAVERRLRELELERFRPFRLVGVEPGAAWELCWQAGRLSRIPRAPLERPLVSSSFADAAVRARRIELYRRLCPAPGAAIEEHRAFHASHDPERGPFSPCMHREDARSVSFAWISVGAQRIEFRYWPDSPCRAPERLAGHTLSTRRNLSNCPTDTRS